MTIKTAELVDYYDVLDVEPTATLSEIKRSFRKKVKEQHPDLRKVPQDSPRNIRLLIQAYKTLSNPSLRREYDRTHWFYRRPARDFDYREFLKSRPDDLESQAKLIFYDLLHKREEDALALYESLVLTRSFELDQFMDREDFMDCAFLLAEEYEKAGNLPRACDLLSRVAEYEFQQPYFKHFFLEVERRLQTLVCLKMPGKVEPVLHLSCVGRLAALDFPKKFAAQLFKKAAELHLELDNPAGASRSLEEGLKLDKKLKGIEKIRERLAGAARAGV
jgi:curved DNA-binding protein CbpA